MTLRTCSVATAIAASISAGLTALGLGSAAPTGAMALAAGATYAVGWWWE